MEYYDLAEDEFVLYKGFVWLRNKKDITEIILTNINFVLITKIKKLFGKEDVIVDVYPTEKIKYYKGEPQVIKNGKIVALYFLHDETEFMFESRNECGKFMNSALKLLTDKNKFERGVDKTKAAIKCVDNSLGVDSVEIVKTGAKFAFMNKTAIGNSAVKTVGAIKSLGFGRKKSDK